MRAESENSVGECWKMKLINIAKHKVIKNRTGKKILKIED